MTKSAFNHTIRLANEAVRVAEANIDFVYDKEGSGGACNYYPETNNPQGCLFGAAARNIGTSFDDYQGSIVDTLYQFYADGGYSGPDSYTPEELIYRNLHNELETAQEAQDTGICWGLAIPPLKNYLRVNELLEDDLK